MPYLRTVTIKHLLTIALAAWLLSACQPVPEAFGPTRAQARTNADELMSAFTRRFTNVYRSPKYAEARSRLGKYALTPSAVYGDTLVWTQMDVGPEKERILYGNGRFANNRYAFFNVPSLAPLDDPADGRHVMRLKRVGESEYEWNTSVDFAAGHIAADDAGAILSTMLKSAEGRSGTALAEEMRANFPRTAAALGRLLHLDTLISVKDSYGGNTTYIKSRIVPGELKKAFPKFAAYMDKYITPMKIRLVLSDQRGAKWADVSLSSNYLVVKLRSHDGKLAPLEGALRPIPDSLYLDADFVTKVKIFTAGFNGLHGDFVISQTAHERSWSMIFRKEPDWVLPIGVQTLIKTPLRRPFQKGGTRFIMGISDNPGGQTLIWRRATSTVQESAIIRFLNKLSGTLMGDYVDTAEQEENKFDMELFSALRADFAAALR